MDFNWHGGDGAAKTMGNVADEWMRRHHPAGDAQINTISTESFT
ncbi:hypothetical protein [Janthinobacterium lividum]|nr:hypothetical protein [Janthinobacterium lividum]